MHELTDSQLAALHLAARENPEMRSQFIRALYPQLRLAARRSVGPGLRRLTDTDDLVQSTLGDCDALFDREFQGRAHLVRWFYRGAQWNANNKRLRSQSLRRGGGVVEERPDLNTIRGALRTPSRILASADSKLSLRRGIDALPGMEREVMRRRAAGEHFTLIATDLGLTISEVRTLAGRAVRRLGEFEEGSS